MNDFSKMIVRDIFSKILHRDNNDGSSDDKFAHIKRYMRRSYSMFEYFFKKKISVDNIERYQFIPLAEVANDEVHRTMEKIFNDIRANMPRLSASQALEVLDFCAKVIDLQKSSLDTAFHNLGGGNWLRNYIKKETTQAELEARKLLIDVVKRIDVEGLYEFEDAFDNKYYDSFLPEFRSAVINAKYFRSQVSLDA